MALSLRAVEGGDDPPHERELGAVGLVGKLHGDPPDLVGAVLGAAVGIHGGSWWTFRLPRELAAAPRVGPGGELGRCHPSFFLLLVALEFGGKAAIWAGTNKSLI